MTRDEYLTYDPPNLTDEKEKATAITEARVAMNQLFLKDLLLNERRANSCVPLVPDGLMYVHAENRVTDSNKKRYEAALYLDPNKGAFRLLNLQSNMDDRDTFYAIVDNWGVADAYGATIKKDYADDDGNRDDRPTYDVILGENLCIRIDDMKESLLYEYEVLAERNEEFQEQRAIDAFKLLNRFNEIVDNQAYTEEYLQVSGLLSNKPMLSKPNSKLKEAVNLYKAVQAFDEFLDSLKNRYPTLSFAQLTTSPKKDKEESLAKKIEDIFGSTTKFHNQFKKLGMFAGMREADVTSVYRGIWHTGDLKYVVGDVNAMNQKQANAHLVRQFHVEMGDFDILPMLEAMSVTFVRLNQYTVRPYYFHLIDIYIDHVLQYEPILAETSDQ